MLVYIAFWLVYVLHLDFLCTVKETNKKAKGLIGYIFFYACKGIYFS